MASYLLISKFI